MRGGENIVKAAVNAFVRAQSESGGQLIKMEVCKHVIWQRQIHLRAS